VSTGVDVGGLHGSASHSVPLAACSPRSPCLAPAGAQGTRLVLPCWLARGLPHEATPKEMVTARATRTTPAAPAPMATATGALACRRARPVADGRRGVDGSRSSSGEVGGEKKSPSTREQRIDSLDSPGPGGGRPRPGKIKQAPRQSRPGVRGARAGCGGGGRGRRAAGTCAPGCCRPGHPHMRRWWRPRRRGATRPVPVTGSAPAAGWWLLLAVLTHERSSGICTKGRAVAGEFRFFVVPWALRLSCLVGPNPN